MRYLRFTLLLVALAMVPTFAMFASGQQEGGDGAATPVEIDWFVNETWYNNPWNLEKPVHRIITEKTGVTINFQSAGGQQEKLNTMIASGDLTDVMSMGWWYGQFQQMQGAGMLVALDEAIPEHSAPLWEGTPQSLVDWYRHDDGHWYGYPNMTWAQEDMTEDNYLETNAAFVAREDIMDEVGIEPEDFRTKDGFVEALKKVRDANYEYNGLTVSPFWMTTNGGMPDGFIWVDTFAVPREDEDGDLIDIRFHDRYLEHILFLNRLYREGLISRENFTIDRAQTQERLVSGRIFAMAANTSDYQNDYERLWQADPDAKYVPVGPLVTDEGVTPTMRSTGTTGWLLSMIDADTDHLEQIIELWEFLASEEGHFLTTFGVEGEHYILGPDGRVQWTESYLEMVDDPEMNPVAEVGNGSLWFMQDRSWRQRVRPAPANEGESLVRDIFSYFGQYAWDNKAFTNLGPFGGTEEAAVAAQISTYWEEQLPKMVLAESETEARSVYEESIARIEEMGLAEVVAVQNAAFQENKQKLGLDFAFPTVRGDWD